MSENKEDVSVDKVAEAPRAKRTRKIVEIPELLGKFDTVAYSKVFGNRMRNYKKYPIRVELAAANNQGVTNAQGMAQFKEEEKSLQKAISREARGFLKALNAKPMDSALVRKEAADVGKLFAVIGLKQYANRFPNKATLQNAVTRDRKKGKGLLHTVYHATKIGSRIDKKEKSIQKAQNLLNNFDPSQMFQVPEKQKDGSITIRKGQMSQEMLQKRIAKAEEDTKRLKLKQVRIVEASKKRNGQLSKQQD